MFDDTPNATDGTDQTRTTDSDATLDRRGFLQRTAAVSLTAVAGFATASGAASAAQRNKKLVVSSQGSGKQYYEIHMKDRQRSRANGSPPPDISYGPDTEPNGRTPDRITVDDSGLDHKKATGYVWNDGRDEFTYTGQIDYIVADGDVGFWMPDGAFVTNTESHGHIEVDGLSGGRHDYFLYTNEGTIESYENEPGDEHVYPSNGGSDTYHGMDGTVWNRKNDSHSLSDGPLLSVRIDGHARVRCRFES